jgi:hypothetical protein
VTARQLQIKRHVLPVPEDEGSPSTLHTIVARPNKPTLAFSPMRHYHLYAAADSETLAGGCVLNRKAEMRAQASALMPAAHGCSPSW